jgi:ketosteroid isomerase-like protein
MPPNHSPVEGKQAIEKYLAEIGSQLKASNFQLSILEIDVQGDTTIVRGTYSSSFTVPGTDAPMEDRGKTLNVWKRQADGSWKLHRDIWNSNMPIPVSPQTGEKEK